MKAGPETEYRPRGCPEQAQQIAAHAHRLGFDLVGIVPVAPPATFHHFLAWLAHNYQGEMSYLSRPDALAKRKDPTLNLPDARTIVVVGANYYTGSLPTLVREERSLGIVASYAWGDDYHDVLRPRLDELAALIQVETGKAMTYRATVDTGPLLERDLAVRAGLGFVGKNTNLIHPRMGSWFFLGALLTTSPLPQAVSYGELGSTPAQGTCGDCTRCLDACPTGAIVEPYVLDARRCISYLTIEQQGPIPRELRPMIGNRIFGCDICQEVCPWNRRFSRPTSEPAFQPRPGAVAPRLLDLMTLDDEGFRQQFRKSPISRAKRRGLLRNVAVALGNWGDAAAVPVLTRALQDADPLIRGHAAWALGRIGGVDARRALTRAQAADSHEWVQEEIAYSLG